MKKILYKSFVLIILFLNLFCFNSFAAGDVLDERITDFNLEVKINEDNTADIIETFSINMTERLQGYPINRSFPVEYGGKKIDLEIIEVFDGDNLISNSTFRKDRDIVLKLVQSNEKLDIGLHKFTIKYKVSDIVQFEKNNDRINLNLFGDLRILPIDKYTVSIIFPSGVNLLNEDIKVYSLINEFQSENNSERKRITENNIIEISDEKIIYPGEEIIVDISFDKENISEKSLGSKVQKFVTDNLVSFFILIVGIILFIWELYEIQKKKIDNSKEDKGTIKILIALMVLIFALMIALMTGMSLNYKIISNYVLNVLIKFGEIVIFDGLIIFTLYFILRYEVYRRGILNKILGIFVMIPLFGIGVIYFMNFLPDMFYNLFAYLVLFLILIFNVFFIIKIKDIQFFSVEEIVDTDIENDEEKDEEK
ncbi:MAG: DUF2207 domain-containing protein [Clostridia bacterium]|nr:DUF2207 domain-containing protein [Clostridia bacterium]MBP3503395.1 DUF2207 domain-containing protein [Clostridia bacterium]